MTSATDLIHGLGLMAHPEGGWYAETWRGRPVPGGRPTASAILFLLERDRPSHWHRLDADEVWQFSAGDSLELRVWTGGDGPVEATRLGPGLAAGETVQTIIPAGAWQSARTLGSWTLVGCVVSPAFQFEGFELAPPDWEPPDRVPPG